MNSCRGHVVDDVCRYCGAHRDLVLTHIAQWFNKLLRPSSILLPSSIVHTALAMATLRLVAEATTGAVVRSEERHEKAEDSKSDTGLRSLFQHCGCEATRDGRLSS